MKFDTNAAFVLPSTLMTASGAMLPDAVTYASNRLQQWRMSASVRAVLRSATSGSGSTSATKQGMLSMPGWLRP